MSEQNKMGKVINVPEERWGKPRLPENKEYEVLYPLDFRFSQVPFDVDGEITELFDVLGGRRVKKPGVNFMMEENIDSISSFSGFKLSQSNLRKINDETNGAFLRFIKGGEVDRYILLDGRQNDLESLRNYIPKITDESQKKYLEIFVQNVDLALQQYGDKAALMIL